jgi:hypothetical protein
MQTFKELEELWVVADNPQRVMYKASLSLQ